MTQTEQRFSIDGSATFSAQRHTGLQDPRQSISWRAAARVWAMTLLVLGLSAGLTHVVGNAEASAQFIQKHFSR
jgi:hypothetical protein